MDSLKIHLRSMAVNVTAGRVLSGGPISVLDRCAWLSPSSGAALVMFPRGRRGRGCFCDGCVREAHLALGSNC